MGLVEFFLTLKDELEDELADPELREIVKEAASEGKEALLALPRELGYELGDEPIRLDDEELDQVSGGVTDPRLDAVLREIQELMEKQR